MENGITAAPGVSADAKGFEPRNRSLNSSAAGMSTWWRRLELGETSGLGKRRIFPITGGAFRGSGFQGHNHGQRGGLADRHKGRRVPDRHPLLLRTDDGEYVYLQTKGYRFGPRR